MCIPHVAPILIGSRVPSVASVLFWLWIPNAAAAYLGCGYPTLLRLIWVVDTQRCCGSSGVWIPNIASVYLGCKYPTFLHDQLFGLWTPNVTSAYLGCGYPTWLQFIWVVDTQRCSAYLGCGYTQRCFGLSGL